MKTKFNFTVTDESAGESTHTLLDLCDSLPANALQPLLESEGEHWDRQFMNFLTFANACDPFEPTGTLLLSVPGRFAGRIGQVQEAVNRALRVLGVKTGAWNLDSAESVLGQEVYRIPVLENPTVLIAPPRVNVAYARGCVVLRDLLGYEPVDGRYEFAADDLLQRAAAVTDDKIAACTASPVRVTEGIRRVPSPMGMVSIRRCLEEIKQFALWASRHNYQRLAAV
jgi:hypothetical protein